MFPNVGQVLIKKIITKSVAKYLKKECLQILLLPLIRKYNSGTVFRLDLATAHYGNTWAKHGIQQKQE